MLLQGYGALDMHAARPASSHQGGLTSLEVWVILMELVEMVSIPVGNTTTMEDWEPCKDCKESRTDSEDG